MTAASQLPPLTVPAGKPVRVAVYGALASAIRSGLLQAGDPLPSETELSSIWKVSRGVVREALLLLEEDGLVRMRRGRGRVVVDELPPIGLEQLRPIEAIIGSITEPAEVRRVTHERQLASPLIAAGLGLRDSAMAWVTKSVTLRGGSPMAFSLECAPADGELANRHPALPRLLVAGMRTDKSLLAQMISTLGDALGPGLAELAVGTARTEDRAAALQLDADAPVLIMTQTVYLDGNPSYFAKHLISPGAGRIAIVQATQGL